MTSAQSTSRVSRRGVPLYFEDYLARLGAEPVGELARCEGCHRKPMTCWRLPGPNPMTYCEPCLRTMHGHDQGDDRTIRAVLVGLVEMEPDPDILRAALCDALADM